MHFTDGPHLSPHSLLSVFYLMRLSLPSLLEYGSAVGRQRLHLMLVPQHHLTMLPKRVSEQGGATNEVVHGCWTAHTPSCGSWAELSHRHRAEKCKARAIHGTKRRLRMVSPHVWPGGDSISPTSQGSVWHHCHQHHHVSGQTATKPKQAEQPAC